MDEVHSMYLNLSDQTNFSLNKVNKIKDYLFAEFREKKNNEYKETK